MTLAQIQKLDAGYWLVPGKGTDHSARPASDYPYRGVRTGDVAPPPGYKPADFRTASLPEVMKKYPDVPINIEIKGRSDDDVASYLHNAEVLADYLNELGRTRGIVVASFNDAALAHFHELAPKIDLAPATGGVAGYVLGNVPPPEGSKVFQVPMTFSGIPVVTPEFVDRAHGDGYGVHVWTIDDEPTMKYLFGDLGVDGIMSAAADAPREGHVQHGRLAPAAAGELARQALHEEVVDRLRRASQRALPRRRCDGRHQAPRRLQQPLRGHGRTRDEVGQEHWRRTGSTSAGSPRRRADRTIARA